MPDVRALTREWEAREEALSLEYFNQYAGFAASEERMARVASEIQELSERGLAVHARGDVPDSLWRAMVGNTAARETTRLANEAYRLRNEAVVVETPDDRVNVNNVRRFNHKHARNPALRRRVFDSLMEKAAVLTPVLQARFRASRDAFAARGLTPLDAYLADERVTEARIAELADSAASRARSEFQRLADHYAAELFGKPRMEYFDDMYLYRGSIYAPIDAAFSRVDAVAALRGTARTLGLPFDEVAIDAEPRDGKYASPVCFGIRVPGDVRVLYQRTSPFGDYESFYHEMGHGMHFASISRDRPFEDRRLVPNGVAEIFSTLFEELAATPAYLREDLGLDDALVAEAARRRRFMELYFVAFYGANSMHKIRFWREGMVDDFAAADRAYEELTERYMGVALPGVYWQTHHVLSMSDVYAPSYLLANVRKSEFVAALVARFGERWWREPAAGRFLRDECMAPGGALDLDAFSKLDAEAYLRRVLAE